MSKSPFTGNQAANTVLTRGCFMLGEIIEVRETNAT
jgi:hypothetical protein